MSIESDEHALTTGMVCGLLIKHGITAQPVVDDDGYYTDVLLIQHENREFRVQVLPR